MTATVCLTLIILRMLISRLHQTHIQTTPRRPSRSHPQLLEHGLPATRVHHRTPRRDAIYRYLEPGYLFCTEHDGDLHLCPSRQQRLANHPHQQRSQRLVIPSRGRRSVPSPIPISTSSLTFIDRNQSTAAPKTSPSPDRQS